MNSFDAILEKNQIKPGIEVDEAYLTSLKEDIGKMVDLVIGTDNTPTTGSEVIPYKIRKDLRREQRQRALSYLKGGK